MIKINLIQGDSFKISQQISESVKGRRIHLITSPPYNKGIVYDEVKEPKKTPLQWCDDLQNLYETLTKDVDVSSSVWMQISDERLELIKYVFAMQSKFCIHTKILWLKSCTEPDGTSWGQFRPYTGVNPHSCFEWILKLSVVDNFKGFNRKAEGLGVPPVDQKNKKRFKSCESGLRCRGDVWAVPHVSRRDLKHPCPYPPELVRLALLASGAKPGDLVVDPFCGIGSSGVAAKQLGIDFLGIDMSENYLKTAEYRILNS